MAEKTLRVNRRELKYEINYFQLTTLTQRLSNILIEDKNNGQNGYLVRSLYFDSYGNTDFYEKLSGDLKRKKIRLRIYSYDDPKVKLEIKRKFGDAQIKETLIITKVDALELINLNYEVLKNYESKTADMIYNILKINRLRPVALIEYRRKAFMHPMNNIRITLDYDIKSNETSFDFFAKDPVLIPTDFYNTAILEVKYNDFIFKWLTDILTPYNLDRQSYSKYMVSRGIFERYMG